MQTHLLQDPKYVAAVADLCQDGARRSQNVEMNVWDEDGWDNDLVDFGSFWRWKG